ncbi:glycosyltransferase [Vibrio cyclitrophicus]
MFSEFIKNQKEKETYIYSLNCSFKSYKTKKLYSDIVKYYSNKKICSIEEKLGKIKRSNLFLKMRNKEATVFYLGTDESQDKSGFLQSLQGFASVKYFTKNDGNYGQYNIKDGNCKDLNSARIKELITDEYIKKNRKLDLFLMQTWAWRIKEDIFYFLKEAYPDIIIANICMDDRHSYTNHGNWNSGTFGLIKYLDFSLVTSKECVEWYLKEGVPSFYFPEASDKNIFHPYKENLNKKYQIGFVGACYGIRKKIVDSLISDGLEVKAYGNGWPSGRLDLDKTNEFYNDCELILGCGTIGHCSDFYALKLRDFDVPMSGAIYLTHDNDDLHELFDINNEIFLAKGIKDFREKARYILNLGVHEKQRIRDLARKKSEKYHTYTFRLNNLIKEFLNE